MELYVLVYDADCGPCRKFKRVVDWLDKYNRLAYVSLVDADQQGILNSLPRTRRHKSFHLISPGVKVSSGANAIPTLLAVLPLGGLVSYLILQFPPGQQVVDFVYSIFSRLHDTGSCSYHRNSLISISDRQELSAIEKAQREGNTDYINDGLIGQWPKHQSTSCGILRSCFN